MIFHVFHVKSLNASLTTMEDVTSIVFTGRTWNVESIWYLYLISSSSKNYFCWVNIKPQIIFMEDVTSNRLPIRKSQSFRNAILFFRFNYNNMNWSTNLKIEFDTLKLSDWDSIWSATKQLISVSKLSKTVQYLELDIWMERLRYFFVITSDLKLTEEILTKHVVN